MMYTRPSARHIKLRESSFLYVVVTNIFGG